VLTVRSVELRSDRIAVVIPCFNDGETLREAVASVACQEVGEIVVVDDGSTDPATLEVLEAMSAAGITVERQENGGLSSARMLGVARTMARYVMPLDADDELGPGMLARLADALDASPDANVAWGDVELFGDIHGYVRLPLGIDPWKITYVSDVPGTSLVRRSALLDAGGWRLDGGNEDWDLWMTFAERGWRGVYVPGLMLRYRIRGGRMNHGVVAAHARQLARLKDHHPELFESRRRNWLRSRATLRTRLLFPIVDRLPVSVPLRRRLFHAIDHPVRVPRLWWQRRRLP
jgi:glycosyltransferase involved in cell wall biosynthesis